MKPTTLAFLHTDRLPEQISTDPNIPDPQNLSERGLYKW